MAAIRESSEGEIVSLEGDLELHPKASKILPFSISSLELVDRLLDLLNNSVVVF